MQKKCYLEQSRLQAELALREQRIEEVTKFARDMEETVDNVREALGLESTHFLVIADQVAEVVKERDALRKANEESVEAALIEVRALFPDEQIIISIRDCGEETTTIRGTSLEHGIQVGMNGREFDADDLSVTLQMVRDFAAHQSREDEGK